MKALRSRTCVSVLLVALLVLLACAPAAQPAAAPAPQAPAAPKPAAPAAAPAPAQPAAPAPAPAQPAAPAPAAPKKGGTLTLAQTQAPNQLDPVRSASALIVATSSLYHSQLLMLDRGLDVDPYAIKIIGDVAESWEQPDPLTYIFHLRKGIKWHDIPPVNGRELTSDDVKFSINRYHTEPLSSFSYWYDPIKNIDTPDKYTVKITLKQPHAPFIQNLASPLNWVHAKEVVEKDGDLNKTPLGTGPFILKKWDLRGTFHYERNPNFYIPDQPYLDAVDYLLILNTSTYLAALRTGQLDLGSTSGKANRDSIARAHPEFKTLTLRGAGNCRFYFRPDKGPPFDNIKFRQAAALSLDRQGLIKALWQGDGYDEGPMPLGMGDFALDIDQLGEASKLYKRDVALAKKLLAEAGYPQGLKVKSEFSTNFIEWEEPLAINMREAGIDVQIDLMDFSQFVVKGWIGKQDEMTAGCVSYPEPDEYLFGQYHPSSNRNVGHVNDPILNPLIDKQRAIMDREDRKKVFHEALKYVANQVYYINVPRPFSHNFWKPELKNYYPHAMAAGNATFRKVWLDR